MERTIYNIDPNPSSKRSMMSCQCELGREKLMTAITYKTAYVGVDDPSVRYPTASDSREDLEKIKCPLSHVLVNFRSPLQPNDTFSKVFPAETPIKLVKRKLAKLLPMRLNNILLTKERTVLKDISVLSELKTDAVGNLTIDVFAKDSEEFSLASIPKETYVQDLLQAMQPKKKILPFLAIKFRLPNQNETFTRSYNSIIKIHEIKKNLGELFQVNPDNLVILRNDFELVDRMSLFDIDYDQYGIAEVDLLTKDCQKLKTEKLYQENPINDVLSISVPFGDTLKQVNVEIFTSPFKKPYLGGYRNIHTGTEYHHAITQTPQKPEKVPSERKTSRDTQTAVEKEIAFETPYSRATQMYSVQAFIPSVTDRVKIPQPYETYQQMIARLNHGHYASVIQRAFRSYLFRQKVYKWLKECLERIARMKEEDRLEYEAMMKRLRRDLVTKTFPRTREDFDQLYAMVDRWKHAEIARISKLHSKGPKIAEFSLLLDKEVELLRCIEDYRVKVRDDYRKKKNHLFLEELSKPLTWYGRDGKIITMETVEIQRAKKLKELYNTFLRETDDIKERIELLVDMKFALQEFKHPLAEDTIRLLDRECDLIVRRCNSQQMDFLRRRIAASLFQLLKTSELNCSITKLKEVRDYRQMKGYKMFSCEKCLVVKSYKEFPIHAGLNGIYVCTSCSWKDTRERVWIDMTPFKFILRAVQRDERKRKCWGSLAFVLQEKDIFFIVEKLWHSHSAISECADITELRLCRWHVNEDWSPWNCFLITLTEMKAHLKLHEPEAVYDEELVQKVGNTHKLARANFHQLTSVNKRFTESGDWHNIRAPAIARVPGVEPI